ncbi:MAG TPA: sugar phosphate isomerase/epimerase family protein [Bryobacteraceae bacterium]|nr:sugar phosphate isomerase/epimerase family protein [Bryobacteraceae bacterium]
MRLSRREIAKLIIAAPLSAAVTKINSRIDGVMIGAQSYSFRAFPLEQCVADMKDIGLGFVELWQGHLEPKDEKAATAWRKDPPMDEIRAAKKRFDDAGIVIYALNYSFRDSFSEVELENGFKIAHALGTDKITASANVDVSARVDPLAEKYRAYVGFHNHDSMEPNEFSTPADFDRAMAGRSKYMKINLDIGHFTAANFDPVSYLEQHHDDILTLHIKDRKKDHGTNVPFGRGDTRIKDVLQILKSRKYPIPAMIEYEYAKPEDALAEVRKAFDYMKQALA